MNRNYNTPKVTPKWAADRETDMVVATAIHAIADGNRPAHDIWETPTPAEYDHVVLAIQEYISHGDFALDPSGYQWGQHIVPIDNFL